MERPTHTMKQLSRVRLRCSHCCTSPSPPYTPYSVSQVYRPKTTSSKPSKPFKPTTKSSAWHSPTRINVESLLSKPTWSVSTLLPPQNASSDPPISSAKLHHLLRLSALEPPKTSEEEESMLRTLADQLHFVRAVQAVDTTGVEPLRALRDETFEAEAEVERDISTQCEEAMGKEEVLGKFYKRIRRKKDMEVADGERDVVPDWNPVEIAERRVGKFFVVERKKEENDGG